MWNVCPSVCLSVCTGCGISWHWSYFSLSTTVALGQGDFLRCVHVCAFVCVPSSTLPSEQAGNTIPLFHFFLQLYHHFLVDFESKCVHITWQSHDFPTRLTQNEGFRFTVPCRISPLSLAKLLLEVSKEIDGKDAHSSLTCFACYKVVL